jgi:hypothetical protein
MNKRNVALVAFLSSLALSLAFSWFPALSHSDLLRGFYLPALILAVLLSGHRHTPTMLAGWSGFIVFTLTYWIIFLIIYTLALELYLLRKSYRNVENALGDLRTDDSAGNSSAIEHIGRAVVDLETRRRRHFLLQKIDSVDLSEPPILVGARALEETTSVRPMKKLVRHLQARLIAERGAGAAAKKMTELRMAARNPPSRMAQRS